MKILIPDNIPKALGLKYIQECKDDKEFFILLRTYIVQNINKVFDENAILKKKNALYDVLYAIGILQLRLKCTNGEMQERLNYIGKFQNRYYVERGEQVNIAGSDIQKVKDYGLQNGYPPMILVRHDGKVTKYLGGGKDKWEEALNWANLYQPYSENFLDLLHAVSNNDIYETAETTER